MIFNVSKTDIESVIETFLISTNPLVFKQFPRKEKKKYIMTAMASHLFEKDKIYKETDVNHILEEVYSDHVTLRRYLIDYHFLDRKMDGSAYWLSSNPEDFADYKLNSFRINKND